MKKKEIEACLEEIEEWVQKIRDLLKPEDFESD